MKKIYYLRLFCLLLALLSILSLFLPSISASAFDEGLPDVSIAKNVYFANLDTETVILNKSETKKIAPASTVKILTGLIAIEHYEKDINATITVSESITEHRGGAILGLMPGDEIKAIDLIYATVCGGYNDAAYALAYAISDSPTKFVKLMNEKLVDLGAKSSHYTNPSGMDEAGMYTTLSDTVKLVKYATKNELYMKISSAVAYKATLLCDGVSKSFTINNRNALISGYYAEGYTNLYASGLIAGMTDEGGYCAATRLDIGKSSYICIVMGADATEDTIGSYATVNALTSYARHTLGYTKVMSAGTKICDIPIEFALSEQSAKDKSGMLEVFVTDDVLLFLPQNANIEKEVSYKYYLYSDKLIAPVCSGDRVGSVDFYYNGELLATVPLVITKDVVANDFLISINTMRGAILSRITIFSLLLFICIFSIYTTQKNKASARRRKKTFNITSSRKL